jgi:hypothetical protein
VPEGLSAAEVGKEIAEHKEHSAPRTQEEQDHHDRWLSIIEAILLSLVAVLAAYSGYAAAKWGTRSSVSLAEASSLRTTSNRYANEAIVTRTLDSVSFNAWFTAFVTGNKRAEELAIKRFRPGYRPAFNAWIATDPAHNRQAPPGPAYMPQYVIPAQNLADSDAHKADEKFSEGSESGETADKYIRDTVFLATVLFLVGISGQFRLRYIRFGLIGVAGALLLFAVVTLTGLPAPP